MLIVCTTLSFAQQNPPAGTNDVLKEGDSVQSLTLTLQGLYEALGKLTQGTLGYKSVRDIIRQEEAKLDSLDASKASPASVEAPKSVQKEPASAPTRTVPIQTQQIFRPAALTGEASANPSVPHEVSEALPAVPPQAASPPAAHSNNGSQEQQASDATTGDGSKKGGPNPGCQNSYWYYSCGFSTYIGGVEWSGFSSETPTTNGFLSGYWRSRFFLSNNDSSKATSPLGAALWGRVRLLSAPQASANGISFASTLADPTGSITTTQLSNVGQAVDYVAGVELRLHQWDDTTTCSKAHLDSNGKCINDDKNATDRVVTSRSATRISFVLDGGATTTLPANTVLDTFNAPAVNSPECLAFAMRYRPSPGVAGVYLNTNPNPTTCLMNPLDKTNTMYPMGLPISYVAFTNPDRTNFYGKYGAGFRITRVFNATSPTTKPYAASLDLTIGQDQSTSGGRWWGPVLRADGVLPIGLSSNSLFYLFGSAGMRTGNNVTYPPIILTTPASGSSPAVPGPSVAVLALQVPARDFYRIGIGLNMLDIFCKLKAGSCSATSGVNGAGPTSPTNTKSAANDAIKTAKPTPKP